LHRGGLANRPVRIGQLRLPGERVNERPQNQAKAPARRDLLHLGEIDEEGLAGGARGGLTTVGGEDRDEGLVTLIDLVADDDGFLLSARERANVHAAFTEGFEQRKDLAVTRLAQGVPPRFLPGGVAGGDLVDGLDHLRRWRGSGPLRRARGGEPRQQRERQQQ